MAGRYKFGASTKPVASPKRQKTETADLSSLLRRGRGERKETKQISSRGVNNPMMEDAATVLNTFYKGDPVLQGFLSMLSAARR